MTKNYFYTSLIYISLLGLLFGCKKSNNTVFSGTIKNLSKGKLYLQQIKDTTLVTLDSILLNGSNEFSFSLNLKEPDVFYLYLDKTDGTIYNDRLEVFLEPGEISLRTTLNDFTGKSILTGSKNHTKFAAYQKIIQRFNLHNVSLLQENFDATKENDTNLITLSEKNLNNNLKRKYLYTVNFAIQNKDLEIAPYITLREIEDANVTYLDTIHKSLSPKIKKSKYGRLLKELISDTKKEEKK